MPMKAWKAVVVLSLAALAGCGPSKELKQAQVEMEVLRKENATLKTKLTGLEGTLAQVTKERDQLKASAARPASTPAPAPAPAPAKKGTVSTRK
jgi:hypothetical protein